MENLIPHDLLKANTRTFILRFAYCPRNEQIFIGSAYQIKEVLKAKTDNVDFLKEIHLNTPKFSRISKKDFSSLAADNEEERKFLLERL